MTTAFPVIHRALVTLDTELERVTGLAERAAGAHRHDAGACEPTLPLPGGMLANLQSVALTPAERMRAQIDAFLGADPGRAADGTSDMYSYMRRAAAFANAGGSAHSVACSLTGAREALRLVQAPTGSAHVTPAGSTTLGLMLSPDDIVSWQRWESVRALDLNIARLREQPFTATLGDIILDLEAGRAMLVSARDNRGRVLLNQLEELAGRIDAVLTRGASVTSILAPQHATVDPFSRYARLDAPLADFLRGVATLMAAHKDVLTHHDSGQRARVAQSLLDAADRVAQGEPLRVSSAVGDCYGLAKYALVALHSLAQDFGNDTYMRIITGPRRDAAQSPGQH